MIELKLVLRKDIANTDIQDNIQDDTIGILTDGFYWIEILTDNSYFIPDGWMGTKTNNIEIALNSLNDFISNN